MTRITLEFFTSPTGISPISKFLEKLTLKQETKILRQLQCLQEFGLTPAIPNCKKLTGIPLWELRILGRDNIRIFCVPLNRKRVLIIHIFFKKSRLTPTKEIKLALSRHSSLYK